MTNPAGPKVMLNVRVPVEVVDRLESRIEQSRRAGRRVTKERLVSDAILNTYPHSDEDEAAWLPIHDAEWLPRTDPRSNAELLDLLDDLEASQ